MGRLPARPVVPGTPRGCPASSTSPAAPGCWRPSWWRWATASPASTPRRRCSTGPAHRLGPAADLRLAVLPDLPDLPDLTGGDGGFDAAVSTFDGLNYLVPRGPAGHAAGGGRSAATAGLAGLRPAHRRDDAVHPRQPGGLGRGRRERLRHHQPRRPAAAQLRDPHRGPRRRRAVHRAPPAVLPRRRRRPVGACRVPGSRWRPSPTSTPTTPSTTRRCGRPGWHAGCPDRRQCDSARKSPTRRVNRSACSICTQCPHRAKTCSWERSISSSSRNDADRGITRSSRPWTIRVS